MTSPIPGTLRRSRRAAVTWPGASAPRRPAAQRHRVGHPRKCVSPREQDDLPHPRVLYWRCQAGHARSPSLPSAAPWRDAGLRDGHLPPEVDCRSDLPDLRQHVRARGRADHLARVRLGKGPNSMLLPNHAFERRTVTGADALAFLRLHQPMPSGLSITREEADGFVEVLKCLEAQPIPDAIPLLIGTVTEETGLGKNRRIGSGIFAGYDRPMTQAIEVETEITDRRTV